MSMTIGRSDSSASRIVNPVVAAVCDRRSSDIAAVIDSPLQSDRRLEKCIFKRRLKRSRRRVAHSKARTYLRLHGAIKFDADLTALCERRADRAQSELRRIAIAAEMPEHDALDFSREQFLDHVRRGRVRQMTMTRLNPLFHRPRPMQIVLQKFFVVVRFDHKRLHFAQALHNHFRRVTEIGDKTEAPRSRVKSKTERIDCVMWNWECLHGYVADGELSASAEDSPVPMLLE